MSEIKNICTQNENNDKTSALKSQIEEKIACSYDGEKQEEKAGKCVLPCSNMRPPVNIIILNDMWAP